LRGRSSARITVKIPPRQNPVRRTAAATGIDRQHQGCGSSTTGVGSSQIDEGSACRVWGSGNHPRGGIHAQARRQAARAIRCRVSGRSDRIAKGHPNGSVGAGRARDHRHRSGRSNRQSQGGRPGSRGVGGGNRDVERTDHGGSARNRSGGWIIGQASR